MSRIIVLGGGVCGLATRLVLAGDGHDVTLLEHDPAPVPASPAAAWERWERGGVPHFKQAHGVQPRAWQVLERELPDVAAALLAAGAERADPIATLPPGIADRARRPGDERFVTVHDVVRARAGDAGALPEEWRARTERELEPFYRACVASDRARLAEMEAHRAGRPPAPPAEVLARPGIAERVPALAGGQPAAPDIARQDVLRLVA